MTNATTIKDIAREVGVDVSTVSRALNGTRGVNESTRARVAAAVDRLHYRPNRLARSLVTGRSHTIGLVISDIRNPFFAEVARGAENAAAEASFDVVLCNSGLDPAKQMRYIRSLVGKNAEGILMNSVATLSREEQEQLESFGTPIVLLNRPLGHHGFSTVSADNRHGGYLAGAYLVGLGHSKIAHLTGPRGHGNLTERCKGFLRAVESQPGLSPIVIHGEHTDRGGYEMTKRLMTQHPAVTAIFAANDATALGSLEALHELGVSVPDRVSIIGFDNIAFSGLVHPPLTTIHQPKYELGQAAMEILIKQSRSSDCATEQRVLGVKLIERKSCRAVMDRRAQTG